MTNKELIIAVANESGVSRDDVAKVIDLISKSVADTLANNEKIVISGLGSFEARQKDARVGRNPLTGEAINIPASTSVVFKATRSLKEFLNK